MIKYNVPNEEYHHGKYAEYISSSDIRRFMESPLLFRDAVVAETDAMRIGSAYHGLILEGKEIPQIYKTKPAQAKFEAKMLAMQEALSYNETAQLLIQNGKHEVSFFVEHDGLKLKARADIWIEEQNIIADLKTCRNASEEAVKRSVRKYGYHLQDFWYRFVVSKELGLDEMPSFLFIFQSKEPPYLSATYELSSEILGEAEMEITDALSDLKHCIETNEWPGLPEGIITIY